MKSFVKVRSSVVGLYGTSEITKFFVPDPTVSLVFGVGVIPVSSLNYLFVDRWGPRRSEGDNRGTFGEDDEGP